MQCDQDNDVERTHLALMNKWKSEKWDFVWLETHWKFWLNIVAIMIPSSRHPSKKVKLNNGLRLRGKNVSNLSNCLIFHSNLMNEWNELELKWGLGPMCA